jgi:hypothetical protein
MPEAVQRKRKSPTGQVRDSAYQLLGVTPEAVQDVPKIEHLFKGIGGKAEVFNYIAGSEDPRARRITELRTKLTAEQSRVVPFEAFCVAIGASTKEIFGLIAQETFEQSRKASLLLRDAGMAEVVGAAIRQAKTPAGSQERRMMLQSGAMLPMSKTVIMPVHGDVNVDNRQQIDNRTTQVAVLPPAEDITRRVSDRFNAINAIAHPMLPEPLDADEEEDDEGPDETA